MAAAAEPASCWYRMARSSEWYGSPLGRGRYAPCRSLNWPTTGSAAGWWRDGFAGAKCCRRVVIGAPCTQADGTRARPPGQRARLFGRSLVAARGPLHLGRDAREPLLGLRRRAEAQEAHLRPSRVADHLGPAPAVLAMGLHGPHQQDR